MSLQTGWAYEGCMHVDYMLVTMLPREMDGKEDE